jgi:structure-specific recognition protein 1
VVPRGKYTADLYKNFLKLHGSTFNYTIQYKNVVKAFLLPQPDSIHMSFILGFDKPLRQGNTQYRFLIFQFKSEENKTIEMAAPAEKAKLESIHKDLQEQYEGNYYEIVAKIFKMIVGVNIIIPGDFKTTNGHSALRCNVGNQEGHLFPLNKSLIFIKKPVTYIR